MAFGVKTIRELAAYRCGYVVAALFVCFLLPNRAFSQSTRVESFSASSFGGTTQGGAFTAISVGGESAPAGATQGGTFSVESGLLVILSAQEPAPRVDHTPPDMQPAHEEVLIDAAVEAGTSIERSTLYYRRGGQPTFTQVTMSGNSDRVTATIPADAVTSEGAAYYIRVENQNGRVTRLPSIGVFSVAVHVSEPGIIMEEPIASGTDAASYRIVSIPLDLENKDPEAVLTDDLGSYDDTRWRFFGLRHDQTLAEYPSTEPFAPGRAFWFITREGERRIDSGAGSTVDLSGEYTIQLNPGWNLIGTPFNFPIPVENVRMESGQSFLLRSFRGSWNDPINDPVQTIEPFYGYAVFNNLHIVEGLSIDPEITVGKGGEHHPSMTQPLWALQITAESGRGRDTDNFAAVADGASEGPDAADHPEPPVVGQFISVYFPHPDWGTPADRYSIDTRGVNPDGHRWDLEVLGNTDNHVRLRVDGLEDVPETFDVWLLDEALNYAHDLRSSNGYLLRSPDPETPMRLKVLVGNTDFVEENLKTIEPPVEAYELLPASPNPFYSETTIRYVLPETTTITMKVYDVMGREVAVLANHISRQAGSHSLVWDGRGHGDVSISSGFYYVTLNTGRRILTSAVVKVR